jgi:hypothetical protein
MAATFTWDIPQVDRQVSSGLITNIHWRLTAVETTVALSTEQTAMAQKVCRVTQVPQTSSLMMT